MRLLRNSKLSQTSGARVAQLWKNALLAGPVHFPSEWDTWRSFLEGFDLDELYPLQTWIPLTQWCVGNGFPFPPDLARAAVSALSHTSPNFSPQTQLHLLWRSSIIDFADPSPETTAHLTGASSCAETFSGTLKATDIRPSQAAKRFMLSCEKLRLTRTFRNMGPSARLKAIRKAGTPLFAANSFFRRSAQFSTLRGVRLCCRSFSSGIILYFSFCELKNVRPSPVREGVVIQRVAIFNHGDAFPPLRELLTEILLLPGRTNWMAHPCCDLCDRKITTSREVEFSLSQLA